MLRRADYLRRLPRWYPHECQYRPSTTPLRYFSPHPAVLAAQYLAVGNRNHLFVTLQPLLRTIPTDDHHLGHLYVSHSRLSYWNIPPIDIRVFTWDLIFRQASLSAVARLKALCRSTLTMLSGHGIEKHWLLHEYPSTCLDSRK